MTTTTAEPAESRRIGGEPSRSAPPRKTDAQPPSEWPCRAIVPVAHYVYPYRQYGGGLGFACQGVADPAPSWDAARWEAEFLEV